MYVIFFATVQSGLSQEVIERNFMVVAADLDEDVVKVGAEELKKVASIDLASGILIGTVAATGRK